MPTAWSYIAYHNRLLARSRKLNLVQELSKAQARTTRRWKLFQAFQFRSNSIFGLIPSQNAPGMNGKLIVNGAVVAADVGLLAPKGTKLNYDPAGRNMFKIRSNTRLAMRRQLWAPGKQ